MTTTEPDTKTRERLLPAAAALFREKGYAASTTRELAELLGIRRASLYHHIHSKEDLLVAISVESLDHITLAVNGAARNSPPRTRLQAMIRAHIDTALRDQDMHTTMLIELRALSPERRADVLARRDNYQQLVRSLIIEQQQLGTIRDDIDSKLLTLALLNLLNWTIFWYKPEGALTPSELSTFLSDILLTGIAVSSDTPDPLPLQPTPPPA